MDESCVTVYTKTPRNYNRKVFVKGLGGSAPVMREVLVINPQPSKIEPHGDVRQTCDSDFGVEITH